MRKNYNINDARLQYSFITFLYTLHLYYNLHSAADINGGRAPATGRGRHKKPVIPAMRKVLGQEELQIVLLHVVSGYKHREIAEFLGKPLGTVTWTYKNAVRKTREYLEKEEK